MNIKLFAAAIALSGLALASAAHAQEWNGPEIGIQGGYGWGTSSGDVNEFVNTTRLLGRTPYSFSVDGPLGGGHAGYNFQFGQVVLGIEGDAEFADLSGGGIFTTTLGTMAIHTNMDFDASVRGKLGWSFGRILVYGTGGVAFGDVKTTYGNPLGTGGSASISGVRTGWTGGGGIMFAFDPNWEIGAEYRYTDLGSKALPQTAIPVSDFSVTDNNHFTFSAIRAVLTYRFASPPPAPPPVMVPAAAPAPPPPMARTFLVFFDFDKYNLTADARKVIDAAAASYKANGSARIELSGYTDLAGTQAYNLRLSQRRADAVAGYLAKQGVPKSAMDVKWFGKEHPRVPTPDGVREPQNRRVEIVMP